jgi:tripartite-type tricarboxylate transporter receptor subunit TctC
MPDSIRHPDVVPARHPGEGRGGNQKRLDTGFRRCDDFLVWAPAPVPAAPDPGSGPGQALIRGPGFAGVTSKKRWSCIAEVILLAAVFVFIGTLPAQAQRGVYPSAPVRVIVGFTPGGGVDVVARLVGQKMAGIWGQPVVVENRPGASTGIATRLVAASAADGYTVLINSNSMIVNQLASPDAGYDIERQLIPVINVAWQPNIIVAAPDLPVSSLGDVISLSRKRKLSYGTPGHAGISHLAGTYLFGMLAKTEILHVSYKGAAPALSAVMARETELAFTTLPPAAPLVKSGKVRAIAVTTARRAASLPEVPTVAESGFPGFNVSTFTGFFMPAGTSKTVVDAFRQTVLKALAMADIKEKITGLGYEQADAANEDFSRIVSDEIKQWAKVVKESNIKVE